MENFFKRGRDREGKGGERKKRKKGCERSWRVIVCICVFVNKGRTALAGRQSNLWIALTYVTWKAVYNHSGMLTLL